MPSHDADDQPEIPRAVQAAAEVLATSAGIAVGGPFGAVAAAAITPYVLEVTRRSWGELAERHRKSVARLVAETAEQLEKDPQDVVDGAMATDDGAELLAEAMHAAAATLNAQKVSALAKAVANGLLDDQAHVDDERLIVQAIADIEAPHIKILAAMAKGTSVRRGVFPPVGILGLERDLPGISSTTISTILIGLERNGLVAEDHESQQRRIDDRNKQRLEDEIERAKPEETTWVRGHPVSPRRPAKTQERPRPLRIERRWSVTKFGARALTYLGAIPEENAAEA